MATLSSRGRLALNEEFRHEGILGTVFTGRLL
jgi:proline racemase